MNLILIESNSEAEFINVDNVKSFYYNKEEKNLYVYYLTKEEDDAVYIDDEAEKIYNYLKGLATRL